MAIWFAGACVLLSPIEGIKPVEEVTLTPPLPIKTASQSTPVGTPTSSVQLSDWSLQTRIFEGDPAKKTVLVYIQYPFLRGNDTHTNVQKFNDAVSNTISKSVDLFIANLPAELKNENTSQEPLLNTYLGGYTIHHSSSGLLSLTLDYSQYVSGAAHPFSTTGSINYDFTQNKVLALVDLFQPNSQYLERISELVRQELTSREMLFYEEGISPDEKNFQTWVLSKEGLLFIFDPYQVAPYAAGPQQVLVSFKQIQDILQSEVLPLVNTPAVFLDVTSAPVEYPKATPTY